MSPPEHSYFTTTNPEQSSTAEEPENDLTTNFMKMIEVIKEDMNKSLKKWEETIYKQMEEMVKSLF